MVLLKNKIKIFSLFFVFVLLIVTSVGCGQSPEDKAMAPVTLQYWRVWDDQSDFSDIINAYQAKHPNVKIEYHKLRFEEYEQMLLEAFAEDRGPDIFSIHNTWVNKYLPKLTPAPPTVTLPYQHTEEHLGGLKKETTVEMKTSKLISPKQLSESFLDTVYTDVVWPGDGGSRIYALPYSVDTMVLFYNRDLLNNANIPQPAKTWTEFQNHVKELVKQDQEGNIVQAGAAIGGAFNINRNFDLLSVLMMQNGAVMTTGNSVTFDKKVPGRTNLPSEQALAFYLDFANEAKEVYTWNEKMPSSLDAFINGQTAYFFGYAFNLTDIKNRAPKINFGYTALPQIENNMPVNYANYWVETVSKKSRNTDWAWDFINFATAEAQVKSYLDKANKPTALRSLFNYQAEREDLLPFVSQLLTAKSWYRGTNATAAETIFKEMIESILTGGVTADKALKFAADRIRGTM